MTEVPGNNSLKVKLSGLPKAPGVYLFKNRAGKIIYVGKAKVLRNRVRSYFGKRVNDESPKVRLMVSQIHDLETIVTDSEVEALILEANLVKENRPQYNINLRDDKSFPYIRITNEPYPRIFYTRKIVQDGSRYFGPYTDVTSLRTLLKAIRRIFPIRSCNYDLTEETIAKKKYKVCLDYHIKRCYGPCEDLISKEEYNKIVEYVADFIDGKSNAVVSDLRTHMNNLAAQLRFEEAARIRNVLESLENFQEKRQSVTLESIDRDIVATWILDDDSCAVIFKVREGKIIGRQHFYMSGSAYEKLKTVTNSFLKQYYLKSNYIPAEIFIPCKIDDLEEMRDWLTEKRGAPVSLVLPQNDDDKKLLKLCMRNAKLLLEELQLQKTSDAGFVPFVLKALQKDLALPELPRRIEAFDISTLMGKDSVASLVCFLNGKPSKKDYRHFKIKIDGEPDDYAMMREAITRRYTRIIQEELDLPDLILVDGGKGQLNVALKVLADLNLKLPVASLAKRLDEVFLPGASDAQNIPRNSSSLRLLQQVRDESHRFAVTYHRKLRKKRTISSILDEIPGVGPERKKSLLKEFGSIEKIKEASIEKIAQVEGISNNLADLIYNELNKSE